MTRHLPTLALLSLVTLAACGGDNLVLPSEGEASRIAIVQGDGQSGRVGEQLAEPIVAAVPDGTGRPVAGASVVFELAGGAANPDTATTNAEGRASASLVLGSQVGEATGAAKVVVAEGRAPIETSFTTTAVPASANGLSPVSGNDQIGPAGSALPEPLVVEVCDAFGNPVEGVAIAWAAVGGGSVSEASTTTDDDGRTSVTRTLGSASGSQSTQASAEGLAGSPATFLHTATAGTASLVQIVSGNEQIGAVGTRLTGDLVIQVVDADNNPVAGASATWTVTAGGGTVEPATGTTDESGRASAQWTLGTTPGANTLDAAVTGGVGTATFTATATAGTPSALAIRTQPSGNAAVGVPFARQPVIQLRDASGNDVAESGVSVTASISAGGGTLGGIVTRTSDGSGRATFDNLEINGATGSHTLIFAASGYTAVTSSPVNVAKASTTTSI
ncbi:MAG: Ig-like domain-containing protein, partial [Actinomycetes bacterium]